MRKFWSYGICIILTFSITMFNIFQWDFFYVNVITPIVQGLCPFIRILKVIDQKTLWGLLIVAATILSIWLISTEKENEYTSAYYETSYLDDPIRKWEGLIQRAKRKKDERIILKNKLEDLSNSIDTCLNDSLSTEVNLNVYNLHNWNFEKIQGNVLSKITRKYLSRQDADFESQLSIILTTMEDKMEIYHDDES
ncbi:MAG: hypothetical protein FP831_06005 [Anaerolineae bacterium]|nr:hypothetical protein [Anaerolineae bacterium]